MKSIVITQDSKAGWQKRWRDLSAARFQNDFHVAELAKEIRDEFPNGDAGDLQFGQWIATHLKGARTKALLQRIRAVNCFSEAQWKKFGGWMGVQFLMGLTLNQRYKVIGTFEGPGPYHYSTIRIRALKLGITTTRKGRDTRSQSEVRVQALRQFIVDLYKKRKDLPTIPAHVQLALTPSILSSIPLAARA